MAPGETRTSYVKEFVQDLAESGLQQVLGETLTQSLQELEKRFRAYRDRYRQEEDLQKIRDDITQREKRISGGFYQDNKKIKRSQVRHIHREALRNCYSLLTNDLDLFHSKLMDDLLASDVVSVSDQESIKGRDTRKRQNEEFYGYLVGRLTFEEFHKVFLPALSKDHQHVADALIRELDRLEDEYQNSLCVACRARKLIQLKRLATPLLTFRVIDLPMFSDLRSPGLSNNSKWTELRQTVCDADIIKAMGKKYPDFYQEFQQQGLTSLECCCPTQDVQDTAETDVQFVREVSDEESMSGFESCYSGFTDTGYDDGESDVLSFQIEDLDQNYKMTANPRGMCLIVNNDIFTNTQFGDRRNSEIDVSKLTSTFQRLQFTVEIKHNLTSSELLQVLNDCAKRDHSQHDAFVCVVLTHGDQDGLIGSDGVFVKITDLTSPFKSRKCPSLAGKPKVFIFQASRGDGLMEGQDEGVQKEIIADEADFLIGHSTAEGYASFRNLKTGSHYINALTSVLDSQAEHHDLLECLTLTNREVSRVNMRGHSLLNGRKQVPAPVFTLTKKLYFTVDPSWPH